MPAFSVNSFDVFNVVFTVEISKRATKACSRTDEVMQAVEAGEGAMRLRRREGDVKCLSGPGREDYGPADGRGAPGRPPPYRARLPFAHCLFPTGRDRGGYTLTFWTAGRSSPIRIATPAMETPAIKMTSNSERP